MTKVTLQVANVTEQVTLLISSMIVMQEVVLVLCILNNNPTKQEKLNQVSERVQENYVKIIQKKKSEETKRKQAVEENDQIEEADQNEEDNDRSNKKEQNEIETETELCNGIIGSNNYIKYYVDQMKLSKNNNKRRKQYCPRKIGVNRS